MKKTRRSLTAAAVASALAFGGVAVATAQIPAPQSLNVDGTEYFLQKDGSYVSRPQFGNPVKLTKDQAQPFIEKLQGTKPASAPAAPEAPATAPAPAATDKPAADDLANAAPATKDDKDGNKWYQHLQDKNLYVKDRNDANMAITDAMREAYNKAFPAAAPAKPADNGTTTQNSNIPAPATKQDKDGNTWYQHMKDKNLYVDDPGKVNSAVTPEMWESYKKAFPDAATPGNGSPETNKPGVDSKKLAWLALPAALVIGGIVWHLAKDGKTYVKDSFHAKQMPTAQEKAASEKMLQEHKDEVIAQGGKLAQTAPTAHNGAASENGAPHTEDGHGQKTTTARGMLAQTGANTVARGLAAIAVAAMVAAGAVVARRKIFA